MFNLGFPELIFIFLIVLLLFGGKKIPEVARGLGKGIREFKKAKDGLESSVNDEDTHAESCAKTQVIPPVKPDSNDKEPEKKG